MQKSYFVEKKMILLTGEYDGYGTLCTRVVTGGVSFLVDQTPLQLLDDNLVYIGYDLRGAMSSAKNILGERVGCPIIINPYLGICLFPNKSPYKSDCIWFNPEHIVRTKAIGAKTEIELSNGHSIIVDTRLTSFNNKILQAKQLMQITVKGVSQPEPILFYFDPSRKQPLSKENQGKFNFSNLEDHQK
ncbi:competence protein ComK [Neobacillus drentensis]|uniref:competence protein ComK n=1 Tax=Neobacillus drentensis TaxID=220684 RepID=UPI002FFFA1AF